MIYEILLALITMQPVAENNIPEKRVTKTQIKRQIEWPVGGWNTKHWGAIRLLDDGYVIDLDPEGKLQNWGIWQYHCSENAVLIIWMESSMMEVIAKEEDKYYRQSAYPFGISSEIVEVKKIFKEDK